MTTEFTSVIPHKLLITSTPDSLHKEISDVLDGMIPSLISNANESLWHRIFGTSINLNEGLSHLATLDNEYIAAHPEMAPILHQAYCYLTAHGFDVDPRMDGYILYDYYDVNSDVPVETKYADQICDNDIDRGDYHSCTFVVQKDETVKGDYEIYTENPGMFYEGKKFVLPITSKTTMLRSGSLLYNVQPHSGKGKEMSITFHLSAKQ
jgi:hypothetical protein